ncbi:alpha/beta hydrolase [Limosilactobacillus mucosae]|uniref:Alpha/beta hydrolase n=1 Tax=Limosilactobacillus mucosae TaxID=97478 RepID=A0AAJ1HSV6_LIMMU|nr:alpha/beta hydrolase [Limosilactobacillus mucosae]MDC2830131.1 alpha/beta hydrolase [Limosilactobacillus mucosae]MDC2837589.1 alpha/beta hydrolase [Limosilactobacillus mucosae]MDC2849639.1 alpha/beta hydrolase [Limosilactobacillus mucosae]MDC2853856.1 alpha/beta hydrolase [Limosilactobacillus mucosae]
MLNKKQLVIKIVLKRLWYLVFGIIVIAMAVQLYLLKGTPSQPLNMHRLRSDVSYTDTPTLLIPGQGGNTITFDTFIKRAQNQNIAQSAMVVRVSPTGQVRVKGSLKGKKNPIIQILYDWNYNVSFKPEMHQLTQVLIVLNRQYHVKKLNIVAHSYGGTEFLHAYLGNAKLQKKLSFQKIVLLGVPVEESFGVNTKYTAWLFRKSRDAEFKKLLRQVKKAQFSKDEAIYNIMGKEADQKTDGEVPNIQSQMMATLFKNTSVKYVQRWYPKTSHRQLHEKKAILKYVMQILWGK